MHAHWERIWRKTKKTDTYPYKPLSICYALCAVYSTSSVRFDWIRPEKHFHSSNYIDFISDIIFIVILKKDVKYLCELNREKNQLNDKQIYSISSETTTDKVSMNEEGKPAS